MNVVFKLVIFSIVLNLAVGVMMTAIPELANNPSLLGGQIYDSGDADDFVSNMNQSVNPTGLLEDQSDAFDRVLDMINVGFFKRFLEMVNKYIYGFITILKRTFGRLLTPALSKLLFGPGEAPVGMFHIIINIGYILAAFKLWTGKDLRN